MAQGEAVQEGIGERLRSAAAERYGQERLADELFRSKLDRAALALGRVMAEPLDSNEPSPELHDVG